MLSVLPLAEKIALFLDRVILHIAVYDILGVVFNLVYLVLEHLLGEEFFVEPVAVGSYEIGPPGSSVT